MRPRSFALVFVGFAAVARAQCTAPCSGGGGPAGTDCYLAWGATAGSTIQCTDGDPSCDVDGTVDGTCTFATTACTNVAVGACAATPLDAAPTAVAKGTGAEAFVAALAALSPSTPACTAPGLIRLAIATPTTAAKLKPTKLTLRTTATAGGKRDKDTHRLVCNPGRPGLAANVQPIFTASCTYTGCHAGAFPQSSLSLEAGHSMGNLVNVPALRSPSTPRVKPGNIKKSFLAKGVLGDGARLMPDGCPQLLPPVTHCLDAAEVYTILAWIQDGALP